MQREIITSENYDFITLNELPELSNDHLWLLKSPEEKLMGNLVSNRSLIINKSATSHASCDTVRSAHNPPPPNGS